MIIQMDKFRVMVCLESSICPPNSEVAFLWQKTKFGFWLLVPVRNQTGDYLSRYRPHSIELSNSIISQDIDDDY